MLDEIQNRVSPSALVCTLALAGVTLGACAPTTSGMTSPDSGAPDASSPDTSVPDAALGGPSELARDAISYRDLATHPGCTTAGLGYTPAALPGYSCAAKAYPEAGIDPNKPIVLLVHGNSDSPAVWERFTADGCEETGATEGVDLLAENLVAQGYRVLAVDMRFDLVDDRADDNELYNAAKNMSHGWGVPIAQAFIRSAMDAYPDARFSLLGHSFGVTVVRDALRRLYVNDGYPVYDRIEDVVGLAGANHGVSSFALCAANATMRGRVACELGDRGAFTPTDFLAPLNGAAGAWETPCSDGSSAYGATGACGGNAVQYSTIVMQDIPDGTQQDLFVSEASSALLGADNRLIDLNDFDESNYFFCGFLKNHFGPARALAAIAIALEVLAD